MLKQILISAVTDALGDADVTEHQIVGVVHSIQLFFGSAPAGTDTTISITDTGAGVDNTLLTLTNVNTDNEYFPRELEHDTVGAELATHAKQTAVGKVRVVIDEGGSGNEIKVVVNYHDP